MSMQSIHQRIITGTKRSHPGAGAWTWPARGLLKIGEIGYAAVVSVRNAYYDRRGPRHVLDVPVVSVGNLTVGGTGKTPFVIETVRLLQQMGFTPAVVSRGYGAPANKPNDEERLIRAHCPGAVVVSGRDRAEVAEVARREREADIIVLDDGFQHRRLDRTVDLVLIDATRPFGHGHLLPRGLLREPLQSLRRADAVVLTRVDQVTADERRNLRTMVRTWAERIPVMECTHCVTAVESLDGQAINGSLAGQRAVVFAGIANPEAFSRTAGALGVTIVGERWWPDHHRYERRDLEALLAPDRFPPHDVVLTTEKDAVKLADFIDIAGSRIVVVKVSIEFLRGGRDLLEDLLRQAVASGPNAS